jgi:YVTN family beta-propeller protein
MPKRTIVFAIAILISCSSQVRTPGTSEPGGAEAKAVERSTSQMVLYARATRPVDLPITWEIRKISLDRTDGTQIDIPGTASSLDLSRLHPDQKLVTISEVEEGEYLGLTIVTREVRFEDTGEPIATETNFIRVNHDFSIVAGDSRTLTVLIDPLAAGSARKSYRFEPVLMVEDENPNPMGKVVFVSNELSSNISIIDKTLKRVIYNVFVGTKPYALGTEHRRNRLYIADRKDGVIYEMDMIRLHLVKATQIDFVDEPVHIEPIPVKDLYIVVNFGSDTVYLVDSFTAQIVETVEVGDGPVDAVYSTSYDKAFVLNHFFGTISVLDLATTPVEVDTVLQVELQPTALAIDDNIGWLYVTNGGSTDLSIIRLETLGLEKTVTVGIGAGDLVFDSFRRRIYVGMRDTREILCIDPYAGVVSFSVRLPSPPGRLLFDEDEKDLYVTLPEGNAVVIIDPMTRRITSRIETGYRPSSIAIRF